MTAEYIVRQNEFGTIYETRNNTVYFHSKNKFWSDEINSVRRQTTSCKSCRTFLSDDIANQMSPDLMHMGSALLLDSSLLMTYLYLVLYLLGVCKDSD